MPWLALPFRDERCAKLAKEINLKRVPHMVPMDRYGKTIKNTNAFLHIVNEGPKYLNELIE